MDIIIRNGSNQPIYKQICQQIKQLILTGTLTEGEHLPSIRGLAKTLRISVITTKRAYDELEREGYLYTVAGKGCFVAKVSTEQHQEENQMKIEEHLREAWRLAQVNGLQKEELIQLLYLLEVEE